MNEDPAGVRCCNFISLKNQLEALNPELVLVFGSYLKNPLSARDLDLLLVSNCFENTYFQHRSKLLPKEYHRKRIDAFCYTPKEFRSLFGSDQPFIRAIRNNHLELIGEFAKYY